MTQGRYRALLIGSDLFPDDPHNLPRLEGAPIKDVAGIYEALTDPRIGLFESGDVVQLLDASLQDIRFAVEEFFASANRLDTLLFYYSGHGVRDISNRLYLCAKETRTLRLRSTALSADEVNTAINECPAAAVVIVLDCCHSGAFRSGEASKALAGSGRYVLASSRASALAQTLDGETGRSPFTAAFVDGLHNASPDQPLQVSDLYRHIYDRLTTGSTRQIPHRHFAGDGDVVIARRAGVTTYSAPRTPDPAVPLDPGPSVVSPAAPQPTPANAGTAPEPVKARWVPLSQQRQEKPGPPDLGGARKPALARLLMLIQSSMGLAFMIRGFLIRMDRFSHWDTHPIGQYSETDLDKHVSPYVPPGLSEHLLFVPIALGFVAHIALAVMAFRLSRREPKVWWRARAVLMVLVPLVVMQFAIDPVKRGDTAWRLVLAGLELALVIAALFVLQRRDSQLWFSPGTEAFVETEPGAVRTQLAQTLMGVYSGVLFGMFGFVPLGAAAWLIFPGHYWVNAFRENFLNNYDEPNNGYVQPSMDLKWIILLCLLCLALITAAAVCAFRLDRRYPAARRFGLAALYATPIYLFYLGEGVDAFGHQRNSGGPLFAWANMDDFAGNAWGAVFFLALVTAVSCIPVLHSRPVKQWLTSQDADPVAPSPRLAGDQPR